MASLSGNRPGRGLVQTLASPEPPELPKSGLTLPTLPKLPELPESGLLGTRRKRSQTLLSGVS